MKNWLGLIGLVGALLVACGGGGTSAPEDPCIGSFEGGTVQKSVSACTACGDDGSDPSRAIDGDGSTFYGIFQTGGTFTFDAVAKAGVVFHGGNFAGALMRIPTSYSPGSSWAVNTRLKGTPAEAMTPANAAGGDLNNPSGTDQFYGFTTTQDFDEVVITLNGGTSDTLNTASEVVRFYEFCGRH